MGLRNIPSTWESAKQYVLDVSIMQLLCQRYPHFLSSLDTSAFAKATTSATHVQGNVLDIAYRSNGSKKKITVLWISPQRMRQRSERGSRGTSSFLRPLYSSSMNALTGINTSASKASGRVRLRRMIRTEYGQSHVPRQFHHGACPQAQFWEKTSQAVYREQKKGQKSAKKPTIPESRSRRIKISGIRVFSRLSRAFAISGQRWKKDRLRKNPRR